MYLKIMLLINIKIFTCETTIVPVLGVTNMFFTKRGRFYSQRLHDDFGHRGAGSPTGGEPPDVPAWTKGYWNAFEKE